MKQMPKIIVSYGAGTNSVAMLLVLERRPEAIVFADTGGERPETYAHIRWMQTWLAKRDWPQITVVTAGDETLEEECLRQHRLPSLAYGFASCSDKFKRRPFKRWLKDQPRAEYVVAIGFGSDEDKRVTKGMQWKEPYERIYPLHAAGWDRGRCIAEINAAGIPQPGKSACFFCPSSKKSEITQLKAENPELYKRAIMMEKNAKLTKIKGLGRYFSWENLTGKNTNEIPAECACHE